MINREYTPIRDMLLVLSRFVEGSGMSLREVARKLEGEGMNLYNVCSMANGKPETLVTVRKFDTYIGGILRTTGHDEYDLIRAVLDGLASPSSPVYKKNLSNRNFLSPELQDFLLLPEAEKYVQYAYNKYRLDKLEKEREEIQRRLQDL